MAVAPSARGKGISRLLMEQCLGKAKQLNAICILLYSNSQLKTAIALYEKYGFKHIPVTDSPFVTADVKMELYLWEAVSQ
jgi:GNAT superfamily N-acetyltransferase